MSGRRSRNKGARGEREAAAKWGEWGYGMCRGRQYSGGQDSPDIKADPESNLPPAPLHCEVKRVERLDLYGAMTQAKRDAAKSDLPPAVMHRRNNSAWLVTMEFEELMKLLAKQ